MLEVFSQWSGPGSQSQKVFYSVKEVGSAVFTCFVGHPVVVVSTPLWLAHRDCRIFIVFAWCSACAHLLDHGLASRPKAWEFQHQVPWLGVTCLIGKHSTKLLCNGIAAYSHFRAGSTLWFVTLDNPCTQNFHSVSSVSEHRTACLLAANVCHCNGQHSV